MYDDWEPWKMMATGIALAVSYVVIILTFSL